MLLGMAMSIKNNSNLSSVLFVFFIVIGTLLAFTGGNIGTNFRHRDMLTPVYLVFASAGLAQMTGMLSKKE